MMHYALAIALTLITLIQAAEAAAQSGLIASRPDAIASCDEVSRDVVCLSTQVDATTVEDAQRIRLSTVCEPPARKLGATHFVIDGPVYIAYRCGSGASRQALAESAASRSDVGPDYRRAGLTDWRGHCRRFEALFPVRCDRDRRPELCRRAFLSQLELELTEGGLYRMESVNTQVFRLKRQGVAEVSVSGVLRRLSGHSNRYITARPLVVPKRRTTTEGIADVAKAVHRIQIPESEMGDPKAFLRSLRVEALVAPKAFHRPEQANPAGIEALEVEIVALRAITRDLRWHKALVNAPKASQEGRCPKSDEEQP